MDIKEKRSVRGGNGNEASESSDIVARAGSFQYGAGASCDAIEAESMEENKAFGTPDSTREHIRGNPSGMDKLSNPHNFSSNPGFMSTANMLQSSGPAGGGVIRGTSARGSLPQGIGPARPTSPASGRA